MNEDFAYKLSKERHRGSFFVKKPLKIVVVLISLFSFSLITVSAYYFAASGQDERIEIVKSPNFAIKTRNEESDVKIRNIDKTIYDNIVGTSRDDLRKDIQIVDTPLTVEPNFSEQNPAEISNVDENIDRVKLDSQVTSGNLPLSDEKNNPSNLAKNNPKNLAKNEVKTAANEEVNNNKEKTKAFSRVQLAALKSEETALQYWDNVKKQNPPLFSGLKYFIQKVDLGKKGVFYRLQVGNFRDQVGAEDFCLKYIAKSRAKKSDCIIVE